MYYLQIRQVVVQVIMNHLLVANQHRNKYILLKQVANITEAIVAILETARFQFLKVVLLAKVIHHVVVAIHKIDIWHYFNKSLNKKDVVLCRL